MEGVIIGALVLLGVVYFIRSQQQTTPVRPRRKIVCIGDSGTHAIDINWSWPMLLGQITGLTVINQGINGDTARNMVTRFDAVVAEHPDYVIVMAGANDVQSKNAGLTGYEIADIDGYLQAMVNAARMAGIVPIIGCYFPLRPGVLPWPEAVMQDFQRLRDKQIALAARNGLQVIDFYPAFLLPDGTINYELYPMGDIHPNESGNRVQADVAHGRIIEMGIS